jgi:hypothetical protein
VSTVDLFWASVAVNWTWKLPLVSQVWLTGLPEIGAVKLQPTTRHVLGTWNCH